MGETIKLSDCDAAVVLHENGKTSLYMPNQEVYNFGDPAAMAGLIGYFLHEECEEIRGQLWRDFCAKKDQDNE